MVENSKEFVIYLIPVLSMFKLSHVNHCRTIFMPHAHQSSIYELNTPSGLQPNHTLVGFDSCLLNHIDCLEPCTEQPAAGNPNDFLQGCIFSRLGLTLIDLLQIFTRPFIYWIIPPSHYFGAPLANRSLFFLRDDLQCGRFCYIYYRGSYICFVSPPVGYFLFTTVYGCTELCTYKALPWLPYQLSLYYV